MLVNVKMWASLTAMWCQARWPLVLSLGLLAQAVLSLVNPTVATWSAAATVVAALVFMRDWTRSRRAARDLTLRPASEHIAEVVATCTAPDGYHIVTARGSFLAVSADVDRSLITRACSFHYGTDPYSLPSHLTIWRDNAVHHFRKEGKVVFNGRCVRLENDPHLAGSMSFRTVRYFDTLATDFIAQFDVVSKTSRSLVFRGANLVFDSQSRIRNLESSWAGNGVGVSTIALTSDGCLVIVHQSHQNVSESGLPAPSGSGSAAPEDFTGASDAQAALARGMERELREECNLDQAFPSVRLATRVTGFARWLDHGGKPEFYGVTWLDLTERQLIAARVSRSEQTLVDYVGTKDLDLRSLADAKGDLAQIQRIAPGQSSIPLLMCLRALSALLVWEPGALDALRLRALSRD